MKQFNLDEYLKNPSRKVVTRDGRNVRILCTDKKGVCPIVALIERSDGVVEETIIYKENGEVFGTTTTKFDLFFAPEKHEGWVNVYKGGNRDYFSLGAMVYDRKEDAEECRVEDCVATVKIEWEE